MKVLVVGGGVFLGPALVAAARDRGYEVTEFNRGRSASDYGPGVERLVGERNTDLSALRGRRWDLVIDTCAYVPDQVSLLLEALGSEIGHYALVSSISVYADFSQPGVDECAPAKDPSSEDIERARAVPLDQRGMASSYASFGPLKHACERIAQERIGERALIARAGLLIGPNDYMDRVTSWVRRIAQGGATLAPGGPDRPVQVIDVRDAARWILAAATVGIGGVFNLTGPGRPLTTAGFLGPAAVWRNPMRGLCGFPIRS